LLCCGGQAVHNPSQDGYAPGSSEEDADDDNTEAADTTEPTPAIAGDLPQPAVDEEAVRARWERGRRREQLWKHQADMQVSY